MTLADLASIGSFISGIAVLISLIYLTLQIRQNTMAHRALAQQSRTNFLKDHLHLVADPGIASVYVRGIAGDPNLTAVELTQFFSVMRSWCIGMSEIVWAHDHHVLDHETFSVSTRALKFMFAQPGPRAFWEVYRHTATPAFARLVSHALAEASQGPSLSLEASVDRWRSILAAHKAPDASTEAPSEQVAAPI